MPEHNAILYNTPLIRGVKRLFGLDDHDQGTTRLSETLYPIADLWSRPEFSYPRGEFEWAVFLAQGGVAGEQSFIGITNPVGSNVLVGIREMSWVGAANAFNENLFSSVGFSPTGGGTPTQTDLRVPNFPNPSLATKSFIHHQVANLGGATLREIVPTNFTSIIYPVRVILAPGFSYYLTFTAGTLNQGISGNIAGWEKRANPGELLSFSV